MTAIDPWAVAADLIDPPANMYRHDPKAWVEDRLREYLWSVQVRIMSALQEHRRVAVQSCHGPGKSFTAARVAAHWIDTHPALEAFVVTSAPTDPQVKAILWREIGRAHRKGQLPGRITLDAQWKISDELVAFGRKPADIAGAGDDETVTAFQGIHARYPLVIFDEASGIDRPLWVAANSLLTNEDARFLAIGNPDDPQSEFAKICEGAPEEGGLSSRGWYVIPISIFDTPNFTGEAVPEELRPYLPSWTWLEENARDWGGEPLVVEARRLAAAKQSIVDETSPAWSSPLFMSKALGRFPKDASDGVVPWSWIKACQGGAATARIGELRVPVELGVDVGGSEAGDETVVRERRGGRIGQAWRIRSSDPQKVLDLVLLAIRESEATRVKIDSIGIGWGIAGWLEERRQRKEHVAEIVPVNVAEAATEPTKFVNRRAELWWQIGREYSRAVAWDLTEVDEPTLVELAAPRFKEVNGRIQVESKDDLRKRIGRSTDNADALLLAAYVPPPAPKARQTRATDQRLSKGRRAR
jgi:hypothetical protein